MAVIRVQSAISVTHIDNVAVRWSNFDGRRRRPQEGLVGEGMHIFTVTYDDGNRRLPVSHTLEGRVEAGECYSITGVVDNFGRIECRILQLDERGRPGKDATTFTGLGGHPSNAVERGAVFNFIKNVLNPTIGKSGVSVRLENDDYLMTCKPDMVFIYVNKQNRTTITGRANFIADSTGRSGSLYLLGCDPTTVTAAEFLQMRYTENAQIAFSPIQCSDTEVIIRYERPAENTGEVTTLSIIQEE
ncbi:MAG: hypothetical protein LBR16_06220 [Treponema sp.]|nr:hypothetical protein [Treponema sp.]